ncbi:response regulator [Halarcobacter sp.]|uniref:response regulator n=1 Tax=Halarcobacter sp. TaxID=2321133 RepID=UPI003A8F3B07
MEESFLKNITILIAEDREQDLKIISNALSKYFNKVYTASNGLDALELYETYKERIDIIISDIEMPKFSGLSLLQKVRQADANIPFIIVSATFNQDTLIKAINLNVTSFLPKPINLIKLLEKIDLLCEKKYFEYKDEQNKKEIENYLKSVNSVALIYKMKSDGDIIYMNQTMLDITGYKEEDLDELYFNDIIHPDIPKKFIDETWEHLKSGNLWKGNTKFISKEKETFYLNNTVFKLESEEDTYITIAFLTTKENLEKRDFHKKVLTSIKEFNLKEYNYKKEIEKLNYSIKNTNRIKTMQVEFNNEIKNLKSKIKFQESQLIEYEKQLNSSSEKYEKMLKTKKEEIKRYVNQIQIQKLNTEKFEKECVRVKSQLVESQKEVNNLREQKDDMYKYIRDLKDLIKNDKKA